MYISYIVQVVVGFLLILKILNKEITRHDIIDYNSTMEINNIDVNILYVCR